MRRSAPVSCPAVFCDKLNSMKELYFDELVHLLQNKRHYELTPQQYHKISVVVHLLVTPLNKVKVPFSVTLLQAMEDRVLLWLEQTLH